MCCRSKAPVLHGLLHCRLCLKACPKSSSFQDVDVPTAGSLLSETHPKMLPVLLWAWTVIQGFLIMMHWWTPVWQCGVHFVCIWCLDCYVKAELSLYCIKQSGMISRWRLIFALLNSERISDSLKSTRSWALHTAAIARQISIATSDLKRTINTIITHKQQTLFIKKYMPRSSGMIVWLTS